MHAPVGKGDLQVLDVRALLQQLVHSQYQRASVLSTRPQPVSQQLPGKDSEPGGGSDSYIWRARWGPTRADHGCLRSLEVEGQVPRRQGSGKCASRGAKALRPSTTTGDTALTVPAYPASPNGPLIDKEPLRVDRRRHGRKDSSAN